MIEAEESVSKRTRGRPPGRRSLKSTTARKEYKSWQMMRSRCRCKTAVQYPYYGGRGITICDRWESFENFYADVGPKPAPDYTLDRIDPNGNYEPGNVRWATRETQSRNRGRRVYLTMELAREIRRRANSGVTQIELGRQFGVSRHVVWTVLHNRAWREG